jgi:flagellar hook assembly protein FlgD
VLLQNYPNPFNPETWVPYRLSTAGDVNINIYNVTGQLVRTLELGHREAGSYTAKERAAYWDGRNATGERVASGVYFYNIQSGSFHAIKRMVIVK